MDPDWLGFVRELCDSRGVAVIFDEVQCGLGRTGTLFAYEQTAIVPDGTTTLTCAAPNLACSSGSCLPTLKRLVAEPVVARAA